MFYYIILGVILLLIILARKFLANIVTGGLLILFVVIVGIALVDGFTNMPIKRYLTLGWYDDMVEDPVKMAENTGKKVLDKVESVNKGAEKAGEALDKKFNIEAEKGVGKDKLWKKKVVEEKSEAEERISTVKDGKNKKEKLNTDKESKYEGNTIIPLEEVQEYIKENKKNLTKKDIGVLEGVNSLLPSSTELKGDTIIVKHKDGQLGIKRIME